MKSMVRYGGRGHNLSRGEKKILKVIIESKGPMNISEICQRAKVSQKVWYRMVENPEMATLLPEALDYLLGQQLIPVVQKVAERALEGSAKHAELLFKLSGLLEEGQTKILQVFGKEGEEGAFLTEQQINRMIGVRK
jgi:hypothetical protein